MKTLFLLLGHGVAWVSGLILIGVALTVAYGKSARFRAVMNAYWVWQRRAARRFRRRFRPYREDWGFLVLMGMGGIVYWLFWAIFNYTLLTRY